MSGSPEQHPHHDRRWRILGVIALAQLMVVLDVTIVTIALPSAQADLGFGAGSRPWVMTAYALAFGSLLLLGGKVSDVLGRKWTFIAGLAGFAAASALGGAASSFGVLVGARALQGVFAALLAPAALSIVATTFTDPGERGKAFGIYGAIASAGAAVGLLLGGLLTELLTWRWTMFLNLAFALPAAVAAGRLLVNLRPPERARIDAPGVLVATSGLLALVYGLFRAETDGWGASLTIVLLAFGLAAIPAFVAIERHVRAPLLPLHVVGDRGRGPAFLAVAVTGVAAFGTFLFLTYYLQRSRGFSPIEAGLAFLPMVGVVLVTGPLAAAALLPRLGARAVIPSGMALSALGLVSFTGIEVSSAYAGAVLPGLLITGAGFGMTMAPSFATATAGVAPRDTGVASALVNASQQIGGSLVLALLSTLFAGAAGGYTPAAGTPVARASAEAAVHGYTTAFWWAAGILAAGAIATALLFSPRADGMLSRPAARLARGRAPRSRWATSSRSR
jgi:EmrB/QacA subfamily drug resistance transporter